jgi:hypothetical protein
MGPNTGDGYKMQLIALPAFGRNYITGIIEKAPAFNDRCLLSKPKKF